MKRNIFIFCLFLFSQQLIAQKETIYKGIIKSENGNILEAFSVRSLHTGRTVYGDRNGFSIPIAHLPDTLIITHIGYKSETILLNISKPFLSVVLKQDNTLLNEVIVNTGYQQIPKERATGSFDFIDNKTLNEQSGINILQRLKNVASGVMFNPNIGNNNKLNVRGISTINGFQEVLVVLDNFIFEGNIENINPDDIESITILKDAAAASIWGAKAGNGVIIITTKKGRYNQSLKIRLHASTTISDKLNLFAVPAISTSDFVNVEEFLYNKGYYKNAINQANLNHYPLTPAIGIFLKRSNGEISSADSAQLINALKENNSTKEYDRHFNHRAITQQYSFNLNGGGTDMSYDLGTSFSKVESSVNAPSQQLNLHLTNAFKLAKNLHLNTSVYFTNSLSKSGQPAFNSITINNKQVPYLLFADAQGTPLPIDIHWNRGYTDTVGNGKLLDWKYYPLEEYRHQFSAQNLQELIANAAINYRLGKSFNVNLQYQFQKQQGTIKNTANEDSYYARNLINTFSQIDYSAGTISRIIPAGSILFSTDNYIQSYNVRLQAGYNKTWKHLNADAIVGSEVREVESGSTGQTMYGYSADPLLFTPVDMVNRYPKLTGGTGTISGSSLLTHKINRFVSFYGNGSLTWNSRYIISASARKDASNIFGLSTNDKWNALWSLGVGWNIANEKFYTWNGIPFLKLRATFGYSGNVDLSRTALPVEYISNADFIFSHFTSGRILTINNPSLRWEKIGMLNVGIDFSTKDNILSGAIEYYHKNGSDLYGPSLYDYSTFGLTNQITKNVASMVGNGIDVRIKSVNIERPIVWTSTFLFNANTDMVTNYFFAPGSIFAATYGTGISPMIGKPVKAILSYKWGHLDGEGNPQGYLNGQLSKDYNAIVNSAKSPDSLVYSGQALPKYFGSLTNTFSFKRISLSFCIGYEMDYYFRKQSISYSGLFSSGNGYGDYSKRWQKAGDELITNVPSMVYPADSRRDNFYLLSEATVGRGDNIRLQFINMSYTLISGQSKKKSVFSNARIYAVATNVGILWKKEKNIADPDYPRSIPIPANYTLGFELNFK